MSPIDVLVDAWARWDELPRDSDRANRMEDACIVVARQHGLTTTDLRARLAEHRRAHRRATYQDCLVAVLDLEGEPMNPASTIIPSDGTGPSTRANTVGAERGTTAPALHTDG